MQLREPVGSARVLIVGGETLARSVASQVRALGHESSTVSVEEALGEMAVVDLVIVALEAGHRDLGAFLESLRTRFSVPVALATVPGGEPEHGAELERLGFLVCVTVADGEPSAELDLLVRMALMQARQVAANQQELHLAQERLIQSDRLASIGQLAAGVAHEINNPVGYISSNIGTLSEYVDDIFRLIDAYRVLEEEVGDAGAVAGIRHLRDEIQLDFLREDLGSLVVECQEGVSRVRQIIEDLKDFSRAGEGEWEVTDLHRALTRTLNIVHNELKYKAEVVQELGDMPPVECQPSQINQVMMNLLVNAAQAIDGHGRITVRTGSDAEQVWFEVEDSGKGIEAETLKHIFDPFFTTKPVGEGTGLGLSISYGIVKRHGGRIEVASSPGEGARFRVLLPRRGDDKALT
jgi:signal transduction histidine kinase